MPEKNPVRGLTLIEAAMDRAAREAPDGGSAAPSMELRLGRRDYDQAPVVRHEKLRTATAGESPTSPALPPVLSQPAQPRHGRTDSGAALLLTGLFSALGAAGLTWLAIGEAGHRDVAAALQPAAVAPAAPAPTAIAPATVTAIAAPAAADVDEVQARDMVERWRQAWASRDVEAYLDCYSPAFLSADVQARSAWAAARRKKLSNGSPIDLRLHDIRVERIGSDRLRAVFLQDYASGSYRETARPKTLLLSKQGGDWRIAREWQGAPPAVVAGTQ